MWSHVEWIIFGYELPELALTIHDPTEAPGNYHLSHQQIYSSSRLALHFLLRQRPHSTWQWFLDASEYHSTHVDSFLSILPFLEVVQSAHFIPRLRRHPAPVQ